MWGSLCSARWGPSVHRGGDSPDLRMRRSRAFSRASTVLRLRGQAISKRGVGHDDQDVDEAA